MAFPTASEAKGLHLSLAATPHPPSQIQSLLVFLGTACSSQRPSLWQQQRLQTARHQTLGIVPWKKRRKKKREKKSPVRTFLIKGKKSLSLAPPPQPPQNTRARTRTHTTHTHTHTHTRARARTRYAIRTSRSFTINFSFLGSASARSSKWSTK